jgi:tetratricopeptide (TPR) repeat protein
VELQSALFMSRFLAFLQAHRWAAATVALLLGGGAWRLARSSGEPANPELSTPVLAVKALNAKSLYFNDTARPWLASWRTDLLRPEVQDPASGPAREFLQAVQSPQLFRQLDRRYRFDALLLVGDPSQYRPLLEHLMETKDWAPAYLDHTSIVFRRDSGAPWEPAQLQELRSHFTEPEELASFLAQAAVKLVALRKADAARPLLEEATRLDESSAEAWNGLAVLHMNRGEWAKALTHTERALEINGRFLPALASKTQILYSTRRFSEAYELSKTLVARQPNDPHLLFYHAKIAHEAHAYKEEAKTLHQLIALAERSGRPTAGYRIYLAQAYASASEAQPAIDEFQRVLADPSISREQRTFAQETLTQIRSRTGL